VGEDVGSIIGGLVNGTETVGFLVGFISFIGGLLIGARVVGISIGREVII